MFSDRFFAVSHALLTSITHQIVYFFRFSSLSTVPLSSFLLIQGVFLLLHQNICFLTAFFQFLTPSKCVSFTNLLKFADINMF